VDFVVVCLPSLEEIYSAIDQNIEEHVGRILRLISQPSIAAQNIGMRECAELVGNSSWRLVAQG